MDKEAIDPAELDGEHLKLTDWPNEPAVKDLKQDLDDAKNEHDAHVSEVEEWLSHYNLTGSAARKKQPGRSNVQPQLIRKQAEWRYPALSEPFLSTPDVFNVEPVTWEDRRAAQQNSLILNHQFNNQLNKVRFIDEYVRTAVDEGSVIVRVGWEFEEAERVVYEPKYQYAPASNEQEAEECARYVQLAQNDPYQFGMLPPQIQQATQLSMQTGQMMRPVQIEMVETRKTVVLKNQPTLDVCNYNNVIIDPSCGGDIEKAMFVVYSFETSKAELEKSGNYTNLERIEESAQNPLAEPDFQSSNDTFNFNDQPRKRMVAYEYWGYYDIHGTGELVPIVATWVGSTMIRLEENPFPDGKLPFVLVQYLPRRGKLFGEPDGALIRENQEIIGAVTRGMIDIMGKSANGQMGVAKDALDVVNKRKFLSGEDYEFNPTQDPKRLFYTHQFAEIPQSAGVMIQMMHREAEALTGVVAFNEGISGQSLGEVAAGVRGALDAASKREMAILRRLGDGMIKIGRKIIAMNAVFLDEVEVVRVTNEKFVSVKRQDLEGKVDLRLTISTAEADNQKAQELAFMLQTMGPNTDPKLAFMIMADIARLRKMPELANKLENYEPKPDPLQQQLQMLEIQNKQLEGEKIRAEIAEITGKATRHGTSAMLDQAKTNESIAKADQLQAETGRTILETEEEVGGINHQRDMEKMHAQAQANIGLEVVKSALAPEPKAPTK